MDDLSHETKDRLLSGTALEFLNLSRDQFHLDEASTPAANK
jgi:hypothetical protein